MPRFLGLAIQTDVLCASGARAAFFPAGALVACAAVLSPTEPESLIATIQRTDARAAELVVGRVARVCFSDTTADREWDIVALEDSDVDDQLTLTCQPIGLRMARKLYEAADAATGAPVLDLNIVGISASDAIDDYVLPTLAARGMSWVARGTVDSTVLFDLTGQWASILEIVRAIAEPGRANGEWQLRRNGSTDYKLDVLDQIGSAAGTLRVRTRVNLLEHRRSRSAIEAVTRVFPRGMDAGADRTMGPHLWRVASVVSGTVLELEDILGGDDPILYDNQLNGLYIASLATYAWAGQLISASVASTQRVTVPSTAAFTAGQWCRVSVGSTENGQRLTSLTSPTAAAAPSAGGLGDLAEFLDRPEIRADCNLVPNPWMRDWSNGSNPPDNWTETAGTPGNRTRTRETTIVRPGLPYALRIETTGATTEYIETPDIPVWAISGRRHFPALWFYIDDVPAATTSAIVFDLYTAAGVLIAEFGRWVRNTAETDQWLRVEGAVQDLSGVTGKVRIRATITTTTGGAAASGWDVIFASALLAEAEITIEDIEYSGATLLWQAANRRLLEASAAVRGQEIKVADLEADDPNVFGSLLVTPGQDCELNDTVLGELATQRVLEYRPDYLRPLDSGIRVGAPPTRSTGTTAPITPADPDDAVPDAAMLAIEASFDEDGQLFVRVIGDENTGAILCVVSPSGEPTEATLMQATPTFARQAEFSFAGPYTLGQTVYIAARGSTGLGPRGRLRGLTDVLRARVVRGNSATSKTIRLPAAGLFAGYFDTNTFDVTNGYFQTTMSFAGFIGFFSPPKGATLTAIRFRVYNANTGGGAEYSVQGIARVGQDGAWTVLGSDTNSNVQDAWETITIGSLAEDTSGDRSYVARWSPATGTDHRLAWIEYDLDVPNVDITT